MDTLQSLNLIDSTSNKLYMLKVTPEIAERAQKDIVFATRLLQETINSGHTVFDKIEKVSGSTESTNLNEPMRISSSLPSSSDQAKDEQTANEKNETHVWSESEVLLLIEVYKEKQLLFSDEKKSKSAAWHEVVNEIATARATKNLPAIPFKKCVSKMESLKRHYKTVKDANKKSGNNKITWKFYEMVDELFAEQPWIKPLSVAGSNKPDEIESNIDEPPPKRRKTLKDFCETLIKNRKTRDEAGEKENQERLAAINKLTDVVAQLVAHHTPEA